MKKKLFNLTLLTLASLMLSTTWAQRYQTEVFASSDVTTNIMYGENFSVLTGTPILQSLNMDIYEPTGDSLTNRPVIIFFHGGNFLPRYINQLPTGDKTDSATVELAKRFSRMGYVVAVPNYRLGWNPQGTQDERTETYIQGIYRGIQDARTCIRWFRSDVDQGGNSYGVDTARIAVGGSGSGGYIALGANSLNQLSELQLTKFFNFTTNSFMIDTTLLGDWNGFGGNPALNNENHASYSSEFNIAFNLGGAIADSSWIEAGDNPVVSLHGVNDAFDPFAYGILTIPGTTLFVIDVSGSSDVARIQNNFGNNDIFFTPAIIDPYTDYANATNTSLDATWGNDGNEGLFPIVGLADGNGPWEFWDDAAVSAGAMALGQDPATILANGYASNPVYQALGPIAGKARAMAFLDTAQFYIAPRLFRVFVEQYANIDDMTMNPSTYSVYPNPNEGVINVEFQQGHSGIETRLIDVNGRLIKTRKFNAGENIQLNLEGEPGMYFLEIENTGGQKATVKVQKM